MDAVIALYTPQLTPRFKWAAKVFFKNAMRLELVIYTSEEAFAKAEGIKVNYSPESVRMPLILVHTVYCGSMRFPIKNSILQIGKECPFFASVK